MITADEGVRGGKRTPLKANVDDALTNPETSSVQKIIVCKRTGAEIKWNQHRDVWYDDLMKVAGSTCAPKEMGAEDPLFILYTSGSTGKPKGVLHTTGGYLVYASLTHERVFDYRPGKSTGAPPTSAGSPATPTSSMARWPTAPPPFCSRACRTTPT